ncbi:UNVERIFIED_CONTAM: movement protein, partial [Sesamum radiatum]
MSFLKDKLKDWCYQASIQKNMKRLRGVPDEPLSGEDHGGLNLRPEPINLDRGQDQQGSRRADTRSTGRTPTKRTFRRAHTRANESFKDCNCWTCGAKGHISPDCPQKRGELRKFEATNDILDAVYYGDLVSNIRKPVRILFQNDGIKQNHGKNHASRLQPQPIRRFRIGGIGKVLNQIGLNQRRHHIIYKVSSGEFAIPMELTGNVMEMQFPKEEILEELSKLREEVATTMKWIHIGTIEVVIKATFKEGIDSEIHLSIMDRRINNLRDGCLGTMIGNLYAGKLMFDIHPRIAYNLADQDFSRVLTLHQDFKRKDLMKEGNRPYSITYRIAYALSNTHHSDLFLRKEYIEISRIFKICQDRITGYRGKEKELIKIFTPREIRQPVIGRYEGMLEIAGHEILVTGIAGREQGSMTLGLNFLEEHKPWGRKEYFATYIDSRSGICTAKPGVFPKETMETLLVIAGRNFLQKILILNKGIREAKIIIGGALGTLWFRVKTPPIYFHDTGADILLGNNFIQTFA